jgi:glycosyltransferase involved in cell wall biosynthesis
MSELAILLFAAGALVPSVAVATLVAYNLRAWPDGRGARVARRRWSVLVPARNEARGIAALLESVLAEPVHEVLVCDDRSTDATPAIVAAFAARDARVRLVRGAPLPPGWVGKPHACHQLAALASGERWLFVDADVRLEPGALARVETLFETEGRDVAVVTAMPRQELGSWLERWVVPLLHLTYCAWLPIPLVWRARDPRFAMANGQILAIDPARVPAAIASFEALRGELVDDVALVREAKRAGATVVFADGRALAVCRMYRDAGEVWRGFSKNLFPGLGHSVPLLVFVIALHLGIFVLPYVLALASLATDAVPLEVALAAWAAVLVGTAMRVALAARFGHPLDAVLVHPLAIVALVGIALNSARWALRGRIEWAGRSYAPSTRGARALAATELSAHAPRTP